MSEVTHKLSDSFSKVDLVFMELVYNALDKGFVVEFELEQVGEINEHSHFLFSFDLFSLDDVVLNVTFMLYSLNISLEVRIILGKFETITFNLIV